ncbi:putative nucleobase-ascorbate transporter 10 [Salvia miltiorrhiza]|uniref:putative nucleobase-ascorbate transporter 10 n=1 Tax=Salvia miltiorrhiza TaxID=226208 RepID=UPI0025AB74F0|nr:putative nucleobase-ascorbate transporter 10 [Salvia miltiorrhiza]
MTNNNNNNHNNSNTNNNNNRQQQQPPPPPSHPALEQLPGVQYCINSSPPMLDAILLGLQHYVLALGSTVLIPSLLVPQMGGSDKDKAEVIQTLLFVSGVNTLLHSLFGTRLPSVIGGSYAFLIPVTSIIQSKRYASMHPPGQRFVLTMREIQGALIMSSCFQMIFGFTCLWRNITRLLTPLSTAPLVTFTGLGLYYLGFPQIAKCYEVGLPALVLIFVFSQIIPKYMKRPMCDRYALLISVAIVWMYAEILTMSGAFKKSKQASCRTDGSGLIRSTPWLYIPFPFQWGPPTFTAGETFTAMIASFVALIESTGSFIAAARYGSATPVPPSVISRGVGWLGIGTLLNALFGSITCSTATVENVGLLALTKTGSRRVIQISSIFMIFFSISGKFGAIFASIPLPIIAASYCIFLGYVSSAGLGHLQFCNLNSFRTKLIVGISFFVGMSLPQYFREHQLVSRGGPVHTHARWFNDMISVVLMSHATVGGVVALVLDCSLDRGSEQARKDNGSCWWDKFIVYGKDIRNDEFYKLPAHLNKCFPSS